MPGHPLKVQTLTPFVLGALLLGAGPVAGCASNEASGPSAGSPAEMGSEMLTPLANVTVRIAGDSTAALFPSDDPRVGWGVVFADQFASGVTVDDRARSGRSTKSFIDEGLWGALQTNIAAGDYVFVQFGHNDEKVDDAARYADAAGAFPENLKRFVADTRAAGGLPVLLTPISRCKFAGAAITNSHGAYPAAVKAVAEETGTPLVDMTERSRLLLEQLGPAAALELFAPGDTTHTDAQGAVEMAALVAQGVRELELPLARNLK